MMARIGKLVFDDLYLHVTAIDYVEDASQKALIAATLKCLPKGQTESINVIKLNLKSGKISLLEYERFEEVAFPTLLGSWVIEPNTESPSYRTYRSSLNPPILHRKELLVTQSHPKHKEWRQLTKEAEELGLFDNTQTIGFRKNWLQLIAEKGFSLSSK
jgi:DNA phosphorothioation-associated putative methyltransferase